MKATRKGVYQGTTHIAVALLLLILFVSVGYFFLIPEAGLSPQQDKILAELNANRELWVTGRPVSFRYVVDRVCLCTDDYTKPYAVTDEDGHRTAQYAAPLHSDPADTAATPPDVMWIEHLFELIDQAALEANTVDVTYDTRYGFPTKVAIDWSGQSLDDEQQFYVRDFDVIEYGR